MKNQTNIRTAEFKDIPAIVELWKEMMDFHKQNDSQFSRSVTGVEDFRTFVEEGISSENDCVLVALTGSKIVGYCKITVSSYPPVYQTKEYGYIHDLAVTEQYRRNGTGRRLFEQACEWFAKRDIHRLEVRVATSNDVSQAFWNKAGFSQYLKTLYLEI